MPDTRTTPSATAPSSESFLSPATLRQPAGALGPRAQRTIARIIEATREVFLTRGYSGTTIDEIARVADVSRASFYTYFPSKREVLLAVGADAASTSQALIDRFPEQSRSRSGLRAWVLEFQQQLDQHGPFAMAWPVAAMEDEEIRVGGMRRYSVLCRNLGTAIMASGGKTVDDPESVGLIVMAMFERVWRYGELYREAVDRDAVVNQMAHAIWGLARQPAS
jgi:AcrR family transcriptional regulator